METMTILIIDDDELVRAALAMIFLRMGFAKILQAENGMDGLRMVREHRPRLVTTDLTMQGIRGEQVVGQICSEHKQVFPISVIVISADCRGDIESVVKAAGADGFLRKPFRIEDFSSMVLGLLAVA